MYAIYICWDTTLHRISNYLEQNENISNSISEKFTGFQQHNGKQ